MSNSFIGYSNKYITEFLIKPYGMELMKIYGYKVNIPVYNVDKNLIFVKNSEYPIQIDSTETTKFTKDIISYNVQDKELITDIIYSKYITDIEEDAFDGCTSLSCLKGPIFSNVSSVNDFSFSGCGQLQKIGVEIPILAELDDLTIADLNLTSVVISPYLRYIKKSDLEKISGKKFNLLPDIIDLKDYGYPWFREFEGYKLLILGPDYYNQNNMPKLLEYGPLSPIEALSKDGYGIAYVLEGEDGTGRTSPCSYPCPIKGEGEWDFDTMQTYFNSNFSERMPVDGITGITGRTILPSDLEHLLKFENPITVDGLTIDCGELIFAGGLNCFKCGNAIVIALSNRGITLSW